LVKIVRFWSKSSGVRTPDWSFFPTDRFSFLDFERMLNERSS